MKGYLLDANVLIALAWPNHTQHEKVQRWFADARMDGWGTCMVTQIAFVRVSSNPVVPYHVSPSAAFRHLLAIVDLPDHSFWPEPAQGYRDAEFEETIPKSLTHNFITDGYLATLALCHGGRLATMDRQLAKAFSSAVLI